MNDKPEKFRRLQLYRAREEIGRLYEPIAFDVPPFAEGDIAGARRLGWELSLKFACDVFIVFENVAMTMGVYRREPRIQWIGYVEKIEHKTVVAFAIEEVRRARTRTIVEGVRLRTDGVIEIEQGRR